MVDKVDIDEEGDKSSSKSSYQHKDIKIDPTKEDNSINCNGIDGVDEEDGVHNGDSAVLRSMLTDTLVASSSGVVGAHRIDGPTSANNNNVVDCADEAIAAGAGTVMFVPFRSPHTESNITADVSVDIEATPVCPDAWPVDDDVQVAVEICTADNSSENETDVLVAKQAKRNILIGLLALCAIVGISVAVAVPLSRRPPPEEEESVTTDQAVPIDMEVVTTSTTDDMNVHKAPVPSFISDALSSKYTQYLQGILSAPGVSFYGDCRCSAISVDEGMVKTVEYNEMNDEWDVLNELRADNGFGAEIEIAKVNQVLAVSMPSDDPNTGSIRVYSLSRSDQEWNPIGDYIEGAKPSLSVEGDVLASVVYGADGDDRVRVYRFDTGIENWVQHGSDIVDGESSSSSREKTYARISQFGNYLFWAALILLTGSLVR